MYDGYTVEDVYASEESELLRDKGGKRKNVNERIGKMLSVYRQSDGRN